MTGTFTKNDLIRLLYDEVTAQEKEELGQLLIVDSEFRAELEELKAAHSELDQVFIAPSRESLDKILNFSRQCKKTN